MRKFLFLFVVIGMVFPVKAATGKSLDYSHPSNWVICEKTIRKNCDVDLFYVLPTIYSDKNNAYMLWHDNKAIQKKSELFAKQHMISFPVTAGCLLHITVRGNSAE